MAVLDAGCGGSQCSSQTLVVGGVEVAVFMAVSDASCGGEVEVFKARPEAGCEEERRGVSWQSHMLVVWWGEVGVLMADLDAGCRWERRGFSRQFQTLVVEGERQSF